MTGFGRAEISTPEYSFIFDIKSVNNKKLEISGSIPPFLQGFELDIRNLISQKLSRGKAYFNLRVIYWDRESNIHINNNKLKIIIEQIDKINQEFNTNISIDLKGILSIPEVFSLYEKNIEYSEFDNILKPVILKALDDFEKTRIKEGVFIFEDMKKRLKKITEVIEEIEKIKEQEKNSFKSGFIAKINNLLSNEKIEMDNNRIYQELALLIDKYDITEEIIRLKSHIQQFYEISQKEEASGKALNFLLQEMSREANTLGVKAHFINIIKLNLILKEEIEKIKEQVQNIE